MARSIDLRGVAVSEMARHPLVGRAFNDTGVARGTTVPCENRTFVRLANAFNVLSGMGLTRARFEAQRDEAERGSYVVPRDYRPKFEGAKSRAGIVANRLEKAWAFLDAIARDGQMHRDVSLAMNGHVLRAGFFDETPIEVVAAEENSGAMHIGVSFQETRRADVAESGNPQFDRIVRALSVDLSAIPALAVKISRGTPIDAVEATSKAGVIWTSGEPDALTAETLTYFENPARSHRLVDNSPSDTLKSLLRAFSFRREPGLDVEILKVQG